MKSDAYWEKRANERMKSYHKDADKTVQLINKAYDKAQKDIQDGIDTIFTTYARNGELSPEQAKRLLNQHTPNPLLKLAKKIYPSIKNKQIKRWLLKRINAPAYRARITRLEALKESVFLRSKEIADVEIALSESSYLKTINSAYYRNMFDIQRGTGYGFEFARMSDKAIEQIILNKWSGEHFSDRVWSNTDVLAEKVTEIVTAGFMSGVGQSAMIAELSEMMNVGKFAASRLIRTETTYMANAAEMASYEEAEIEKYQFLATLDLRTSEQCRAKDLKVFKVSEAKPGVNMPPLHPFCRSTTVAYFVDEELSNIQRRARNPITGQNELVPANMNYIEWHKSLEGKHSEQKLAVEQKKLKNKASDKLQFEKFKAIIGRQGPNSLAAFQALKYNNSKEWKLLKDYTNSRESNMISAYTPFKDYLTYKERIEKELIGTITKDGLEIRAQSKHFIERVFGTNEDPHTKRSRNGVSLEEIKKALLNGEVKVNKRSNNSKKYVGDACEVSVNPETGNLIQVNPISSRRGAK